MLEIHDLHKTFGKQEILHGVSLRVAAKDVIAVIGPSGSGKTTLLRCMNFLEKADSGTFRYQQKTYTLKDMTAAQMMEVRRHTGFVFQNFNLFSNKTALKNVTEGLIYAHGMPKDEAEEKALAALQKVGMEKHIHQYPSQLSGGQQQRVAIARAVAPQPDVIYFDEPTSALDPELIGEVLSVMRDLASEGMTMIVVTHEMSFAKNVSNRVIFMENGYIIEERPSAEFFAAPQTARAAAFVRHITRDASAEGQ